MDMLRFYTWLRFFPCHAAPRRPVWPLLVAQWCSQLTEMSDCPMSLCTTMLRHSYLPRYIPLLLPMATLNRKLWFPISKFCRTSFVSLVRQISETYTDIVCHVISYVVQSVVIYVRHIKPIEITDVGDFWASKLHSAVLNLQSVLVCLGVNTYVVSAVGPLSKISNTAAPFSIF